MKILTLPSLQTMPEHPLWWFLAPPSSVENILDSFAAAYSTTSKKNNAIVGSPTGLHRYVESLDELYRVLRRFNATSFRTHGQTRFKLAGPDNSMIEVAIRTGYWASLGFSTSPVGPATEQLSFLTNSSFQYKPEVNSTIGLLLVHCESQMERGVVEVYAAHKWSAPRNSKLIYCEEAIFVGKKRFIFHDPKGREATGDTPQV